MSFATEAAAPDRSWAPWLLLAGTLAVFGLLVGWPLLLGTVVGVAGAAGSAVWRRRWPWSGRSLAAVPALTGLGVLALGAAPGAAADLFAGLASLALLLWLSADPTRPRAGGRRAAPAIIVCAAAFAVAFVVGLGFPLIGSAVGVAGGLLAFVILLLAVLFDRQVADEPAVARSADDRWSVTGP